MCIRDRVIFFLLFHQTLSYETQPVYRWYLPKNGDHFYTINPAENAAVHGYVSEGIGFYTLKKQESGSVPIYRFYLSSGDHFYTSSAEEAKTITGTSEGNIGYTFTNKVEGSLPLYRYYNPNTKSEDHFYTIYPEKENLAGYRSEGIVGYVFSSPSVAPTTANTSNNATQNTSTTSIPSSTTSTTNSTTTSTSTSTSATAAASSASSGNSSSSSNSSSLGNPSSSNNSSSSGNSSFSRSSSSSGNSSSKNCSTLGHYFDPEGNQCRSCPIYGCEQCTSPYICTKCQYGMELYSGHYSKVSGRFYVNLQGVQREEIVNYVKGYGCYSNSGGKMILRLASFFCLFVTYFTVSYTHLTLPTIYSV
eukprot:TRINITY_DN14265_c0_g1_i2.p1 TRINITY_DN14265_c0_g1~~TRINITY_DN14265_c0_g1_i2.p1  ORF type:complete len:378 (-),score=17.83 TRINITY_DN14265_c0_g1_i2:20-1105(-)